MCGTSIMPNNSDNYLVCWTSAEDLSRHLKLITPQTEKNLLISNMFFRISFVLHFNISVHPSIYLSIYLSICEDELNKLNDVNIDLVDLVLV